MQGTGVLTLGSPTALGDAGGTFTVKSGSLAATQPLVLVNDNPISIAGNFGFTGDNDLDLGHGAVSLTDADGTARTITVNGTGVLTLSGDISDGLTANSIVKAGAGKLSLTGNLGYTGETVVQDGILSYSNVGSGIGNEATVNIAALGQIDLAFTGTDVIGSLIIDGVTLSSGTYNSSDPTYGGHFTGAGSLMVGYLGDVNGDGVVDATDYVILKQHIGTSAGAAVTDGDLDGDFDVDWNDLQILISGINAAGGRGQVAVPEPHSAMLLLAGAGWLIRRRTRKN